MGKRQGLVLVRVTEGLGNRMRAMLGALSLADHYGYRFAYSWPVGRSFGAQLTDLWEFEQRKVHDLTGNLVTGLLPTLDRHRVPDRPRSKLVLVRTKHALTLPPGARPWGELLQEMRPAPDVAGRVQRLWEDRLAGSPYVGVSVRAHQLAHAKTKATSPPEWYVGRMNELREELGDPVFFLSCDLPEVTEHIVASVPKVVAVADKSPYNSVGGIQDAVVDLYLLAGASHVLAAHWSSATGLLRQLAGPSLSVETPVEPADAPVRLEQRSLPLLPA